MYLLGDLQYIFFILINNNIFILIKVLFFLIVADRIRADDEGFYSK